MGAAIKEYDFTDVKYSPRSMLPLPDLLPPDLLHSLQRDVNILEMGGSNEEVNDFDNKKELREFIKIFKKQNKNGYKKNNSNTRRNTRRNKRNDK
jgi:hypothetical protein